MPRQTDREPQHRARSAGVWAAAVLLLAACGPGSESGPGGVSEGEARALDEAAERLDRQQLPDGAVPPVDLPVVQQGPQAADPQPPSTAATGNRTE